MKLKIRSVALYLSILVVIQLQLSCAIEDDKVIENGVKLETSDLTFENFKSKININQNNKLFEKFDITQRNISSFRLQQNNFIKIIHTKKITFFKTADGLQTFTMAVTTNIANDQAITNIVYYLKNNKLNFKVIRYFPTQKWKNQNAIGSTIPYEGTLQGYNSNEINLSNTIAAKQGTFCPVAYVPIWLCNAGYDHAPGCYAGGNEIVGVRTIWGWCPEPAPVGGGGGDPPPATEPAPEPPTGGTGNPVETPLIIPTKPVYPTKPPCKILADFISAAGQKFKDDYQWAKANVGKEVEYGVTVEKNMNFNESFSYRTTRVISPNQYSVPLSTGEGFVGAIHCHPENSYAVPSFGDLKWLTNCYNNAGNTKKYEVFSIVIAKDDAGNINTYV